MIATVINAVTIITGTIIGLLCKKGLPKRVSEGVMTGMALCVMLIGVSGALKGENTLIAIISMAVGAVIGSALDLDRHMNSLGRKIEKSVHSKGIGGDTPVAQGFVTASLLFCVGAMAVVGSLQSGLSGDHKTILSKSLIDGITAIVLSSSLGFGVALSAVPVLIYQGSITLFAGFIAPYLSDSVVNEMTCVGSLLIIAIALNMLNLTKIKVMNLLPAVFLPIVLCLFM